MKPAARPVFRLAVCLLALSAGRAAADDIEKALKAQSDRPSVTLSTSTTVGEAIDKQDRAVVNRALERERLRAQEMSRHSGSGSNSDAGRAGAGGKIVVFVEAECVTGRYCPVTRFSITGPANVEPWGGGGSLKLAARSFGNVPAGRYDYSFVVNDKCQATGSFIYDGTSQNVTVRHYPDCKFSDLRQR